MRASLGPGANARELGPQPAPSTQQLPCRQPNSPRQVAAFPKLRALLGYLAEYAANGREWKGVIFVALRAVRLVTGPGYTLWSAWGAVLWLLSSPGQASTLYPTPVATQTAFFLSDAIRRCHELEGLEVRRLGHVCGLATAGRQLDPTQVLVIPRAGTPAHRPQHR